jgi:hypothetical protein
MKPAEDGRLHSNEVDLLVGGIIALAVEVVCVGGG